MTIRFAFYPLTVRYNHGVALLSALCKERGIGTELYLLDTVERFGGSLQESDAAYVAFSCVIERDYALSLPFMREAKRQGKTVLLGGVYARRGLTIDAPVDFICRGEGETLPDFVLRGDDRLFKEALAHPDLDTLPLPDYELFRDIPFERDTPFLAGKRVLPYHSSRGCPYACSFCAARGQRLLTGGAVRVRYRMEDDLRLLAERYRPDLFFICDELLPYYNERWRDSWGDFRHPFVAYIRADIAPEILLWLRDRGMQGCIFGVESGDERHRNDALNKGLSDADLFRTVDLLKRLGIEYAAFYMTGTPGETFGQRAKTYRMARELGGHPYLWEYEELYGGER